jgi:hypothetical protein
MTDEEREAKRLKAAASRKKYRVNNPERVKASQDKWREGKKPKKSENDTDAEGAAGAVGAAAGAASGSVAVVARAVTSASYAEAGLSVQQISVKRRMGGDRALCRGECHWYACWRCMRFYVPDRDVCDHPYFASGLGVRPPKNGREVSVDGSTYREYDEWQMFQTDANLCWLAFTHRHAVRELLWRAYGPVALAASGEGVEAAQDSADSEQQDGDGRTECRVPAVLRATPRASTEAAALAGLQADARCRLTTKDGLYVALCCTDAVVFRRYAGLVVCGKCEYAHAWNAARRGLAEGAAEAARAELRAEELKWRESFDLAKWPDQSAAEAWRVGWRAALEARADRRDAAIRLAAVLARRRVRARVDAACAQGAQCVQGVQCA